MGNIVAIVGRPNVGKSTLFNRLVGHRKAIVDDFSGVTRDRHYGKTEWIGREFTVIDTGGFVDGSDDVFETAINDQVKIAVNEADAILFMVDVADGITDLDKSVANLLRRSKKPIFLVVNKVDHNDRLLETSEFYGLGFDEMYNISSASGSGTGDLLDAVVAALPPVQNNEEAEEEEESLPKIAIVGRPNVGKSSLVNALLGEERNIVTDVAGTTRDTIHTEYKGFGYHFLLIDTAGIRRKAKVKEDIEFYSVMRSVKAIEDCDVAVLVIDATVGLDSQDLNLVHLAETNGKGLVVLVNKWDLVEKDHKTSNEFEKVIRKKLEPFVDVPVIFTSAISKQRIHKAVEIAMEVYANRTRRIPTHKLNEVMLAHIEAYQPPAIKGKYVKIKFVTQLPGRSPKFAFFCNLPQYVNDSYKRYLENKLRESFDFHGVPVVIYMRKK
ncbi:MAG: ribosome biogenesis GTPase Der [Bacteroidia bacterium]|jgi:GTP-binding protein|nr:ribosome biogenesis GTPase Der [Bacteroidia bacterium]